MKALFSRRACRPAVPLDDQLPGSQARSLDATARACCCPSRPAVTVVLPPAPGRPRPVDLLLCGHHYRASHAALQAANATAYDKAGNLVASGPVPQQPGRHATTAVA